jgi:hypothetical protein
VDYYDGLITGLSIARSVCKDEDKDRLEKLIKELEEQQE